MVEDTYAHFERGDVVAEYASFDFLLPPEQAILSRFRERIAGGRVLDVGVGAGRTTGHLALLAKQYVGTDVSVAMIDACRRKFHGGSRTSFLVLDACDMKPLEDESFDFVLFSFNGLDVVGDHSSRLEALAEMRRVCRPGGLVCFSSENLHYAEGRLSYLAAGLAAFRTGSGSGGRRRLKRVRAALAHTRMWRALNPRRSVLAKADHAMITEERPRQELSSRFYASPADRIRVRRYFVRPAAQIRHLIGAGFTDVSVFDPDGKDVTELASEGLAHAWWLYYIGRRSGHDGPARQDDVSRASGGERLR